MQTRDVGVVLAHGSQASTWKGKTMTQLATSLAAAGEHVPSVPLPLLTNACSHWVLVLVGLCLQSHA